MIAAGIASFRLFMKLGPSAFQALTKPSKLGGQGSVHIWSSLTALEGLRLVTSRT